MEKAPSSELTVATGLLRGAPTLSSCAARRQPVIAGCAQNGETGAKQPSICRRTGCASLCLAFEDGFHAVVLDTVLYAVTKLENGVDRRLSLGVCMHGIGAVGKKQKSLDEFARVAQ